MNPTANRNLLLIGLIFAVVAAVIIFVVLLFTTSLFQNLPFISSDPKPGSCLVVEEKYCKGGKLIPNPRNPQMWMLVAYKIPKGASIFSPTDGKYVRSNGFSFDDQKIYPGGSIFISKGPQKIIYSLVYFSEQEVIRNQQPINKGDVISRISDRTIDSLGDYNLIVTVTKQYVDQGKVISETEKGLLEQLIQSR